jgi:hypothetical protein
MLQCVLVIPRSVTWDEIIEILSSDTVTYIVSSDIFLFFCLKITVNIVIM